MLDNKTATFFRLSYFSARFSSINPSFVTNAYSMLNWPVIIQKNIKSSA